MSQQSNYGPPTTNKALLHHHSTAAIITTAAAASGKLAELHWWSAFTTFSTAASNISG